MAETGQQMLPGFLSIPRAEFSRAVAAENYPAVDQSLVMVRGPLPAVFS
jgi:hypothetical protein